MPSQTIIERFHERVRTHPDKVALRYKSSGEWRDVTWSQYGDTVKKVGKALISLGLENGDKMSLLSLNLSLIHI